jgi:catechol 2,3-dioxygenase-like lactoylglutathione lyase family enzyme
MRTLHVGLRVSDLHRSLAFYTAVGYTAVGYTAVGYTVVGTRRRDRVRQPDHAPAAGR